MTNFKNLKIIKEKNEWIDITFQYYNDFDILQNGYATIEMDVDKQGDYFFRIVEAFSSDEKEECDGQSIDYSFSSKECNLLKDFVNEELSHLIFQQNELEKSEYETIQDFYNSVL